ncbi:MAG: LexA family transcriptional regulator [Clostridiales bacterium]|nr:LexA family transcriptional regulator [Clostridiales bacterium]
MDRTLGSILASYRKKKKISQLELADELAKYGVNVSNAAISAWEKDSSVPNANQFLILCKLLGITDIYNEFVGFNPYDVLAKLNDEGKAKALEYISLLLLSEQFQKKEATVIPFRRKIRWSLLASSAGTGELLDDENFEIIEVGEDVPEEADFGLALNGDSMEPRYHDKQAVWVQKTDTLSNGEIGIFYLDGMTYCKQLKQDKDGIFLISLNSKYQPIKVTADSTFKIFGRVLN